MNRTKYNLENWNMNEKFRKNSLGKNKVNRSEEDMTPRQISDWIDPDIRGRLGLITESLFGLAVKPGSTPIDQLIAAVEANWTDWNPTDKAFQKLVVKVLGKMPSASEWQQLFAKSVQTPELKNELMKKLGISAITTTNLTAQANTYTLTAIPTASIGKFPPTNIPEGAGRIRIYFNRGTQVDAIAILQSEDSQCYYAALRQNVSTSWWRGGSGVNIAGRPHQFGGRGPRKKVTKQFVGPSGKIIQRTQRYPMWEWQYDIITFNSSNVKLVEVLP